MATTHPLSHQHGNTHIGTVELSGDSILQMTGLVALAATAWIHLVELPEKYAEVPYLGVGYVLLAIACAASIVLVLQHRIVGWYLAGGAAAATLVGYALTRTTGLPGSTEDIGNWSEPMAIYAMIAEIVVVGVAVFVLARYRTARTD